MMVCRETALDQAASNECIRRVLGNASRPDDTRPGVPPGKLGVLVTLDSTLSGVCFPSVRGVADDDLKDSHAGNDEIVNEGGFRSFGRYQFNS
jgi:hypothetical protein